MMGGCDTETVILGDFFGAYLWAYDHTGYRDQYWFDNKPVRVNLYDHEWQRTLFMPATAADSWLRGKPIMPIIHRVVPGEEYD